MKPSLLKYLIYQDILRRREEKYIQNEKKAMEVVKKENEFWMKYLSILDNLKTSCSTVAEINVKLTS